MGKSVFDQVIKVIKSASNVFDSLEKDKVLPRNKYVRQIKKAKKELLKATPRKAKRRSVSED